MHSGRFRRTDVNAETVKVLVVLIQCLICQAAIAFAFRFLLQPIGPIKPKDLSHDRGDPSQRGQSGVLEFKAVVVTTSQKALESILAIDVWSTDPTSPYTNKEPGWCTMSAVG